MTYTFSSLQASSWFQVPLSTWIALSKRACLLGIQNWGGGYYARYSQFPQLNELVSICNQYRNQTYPNMCSIAQQIQTVAQKFNSILPSVKQVGNQPDLLPEVQQFLTTIQNQIQTVITTANSVAGDLATFQSLNEAAEASVQNQPLDDSDRYYMAQLGPTAQEVTTATSQALLGWTDMLGQINMALQDLKNATASNLASFIGEVDFISATEFWANIQTQAAPFLQNILAQSHYLSGDYLFDKSPIQSGVPYYIAFSTDLGLQLLVVDGSPTQDVEGGGYSYHIEQCLLVKGLNEAVFTSRGQWIFTKEPYGTYRINNPLIGASYSLDVFGGSMMPVMLSSGGYTGQFWRFYGQQVTNNYIQDKGWLSLDSTGTITMSKSGVCNLLFSTDPDFDTTVPPVSPSILIESSPS